MQSQNRVIPKKKSPLKGGYKKVQGETGIYEIVKKDGSVTGYSIIFKDQFNKTKREKAINRETDSAAKTLAQAKIYLIQRKDEIAQQRNSLEDEIEALSIPDKTLDTVSELYFNNLPQKTSYRKWEDQKYKKHLSKFIVRNKELGTLTSTEIKPEDIEKIQTHFKELDYAAKTINNTTNLLRSIIRYGIANDHCKSNPLRRYKPLPVDNIVERYFTREEVSKLLEQALLPLSNEKQIEPEDMKYYKPPYSKKRLQMFLRLMYYTAQRPKSLLRLQKKDITDGQIKIVSIKKQKEHYVPVTEKLRPYLEEWIKDMEPTDYLFHKERYAKKPISYFTLQDYTKPLFEPWNKGLNFKEDRKQWCSLYTLRHSAATNALEATGNQRLVQAMLNHSDSRMTERYAKVLDKTKEEGFDAL